MEGFSESNSRGLNTSGFSEFLPAERDRSKSFLSHIGYVRSLLGSHKEENLRADDIVRALKCENVSLRQWLDNPERSVDAFECFHVFIQIVEIVNAAHSQGVVVHNVRPSCFVMSSFNRVSFIESASCSDYGSDEERPKETTMKKSQEVGGSSKEEEFQPFPMKEILAMEMSWYTSPEEDTGCATTYASDVYRLGVLLFELFCPVSSREEKSRTMSSLRHRVLPPQILLNWPKEASFCLWLLHPEPTYRPSMSELLKSEFVNEPRESLEEREVAIDLRERIEEQELLLEFLFLIQQRKQETADKLRKRIRQGAEGVEAEENEDDTLNSTLLESSRLMRNFKKLESVYFATRYRQIKASASASKDKPLARYYSALSSDGKSSVSNLTQPDSRQGGWIDPFLEGLCKYLTFSKLTVKADLKQGDLLNSANLVCAIGFDRDGELFPTAGVNKKIKIFECNRSKLSGICWNNYIKSQIASKMKEHEKRVWSIDISTADPTLLASGSDDGSGVSIGTIKTKENVCCVQFPSDSGRSLAFGSADHRVYYYDLRNPKLPLCTMIGHTKTVSYVRFVDSSTLVSSSTDNTLKLWDLSMSVSGVNEAPVHSFMGHTNVKNFVGLSVSDGYLATGSETNEVYVYHKAFPMPVLSYKFKTVDPVSGLEVEDASQFISSVCWRGQSSTLVAANSTGNIKILEIKPSSGLRGFSFLKRAECFRNEREAMAVTSFAPPWLVLRQAFRTVAASSSSSYLHPTHNHTVLPWSPLRHSALRRCHVAEAMKGDVELLLKGVGDQAVAKEVKHILEMARRATSRREVLHTDFLTPPVVKESVSVLGKLADVAVVAQGGYPEAERCRISVGHPDVLTNDPDIVAALSITGNFGFQACSHGDFLGAILGTGITRDKLGDILIQEEKGAQVLIVPELVDFIVSALDKVGNVSVTCSKIPLLALEYEPPRTNSFKTVEASLRIDAVASAGFKISRSKLVDLISSGDVRVNWATVTKNGTTVKTGDVVSVSGKGRLKIGEINETKKGKYAVEIIRYL
ncbi:hypothetical protein HID58_095686 [Brassica napus]|uniref:Protein kinase domain-containing protein n=2 Tax=Brassica napus TaxID=3708 RepID=A0ABQ7X2U6_BRANA|nr:hypothetical protein HID58_095686 [Brassica napus]